MDSSAEAIRNALFAMHLGALTPAGVQYLAAALQQHHGVAFPDGGSLAALIAAPDNVQEDIEAELEELFDGFGSADAIQAHPLITAAAKALLERLLKRKRRMSSAAPKGGWTKGADKPDQDDEGGGSKKRLRLGHGESTADPIVIGGAVAKMLSAREHNLVQRHSPTLHALAHGSSAVRRDASANLNGEQVRAVGAGVRAAIHSGGVSHELLRARGTMLTHLANPRASLAVKARKIAANHGVVAKALQPIM